MAFAAATWASAVPWACAGIEVQPIKSKTLHNMGVTQRFINHSPYLISENSMRLRRQRSSICSVPIIGGVRLHWLRGPWSVSRRGPQKIRASAGVIEKFPSDAVFVIIARVFHGHHEWAKDSEPSHRATSGVG